MPFLSSISSSISNWFSGLRTAPQPAAPIPAPTNVVRDGFDGNAPRRSAPNAPAPRGLVAPSAPRIAAPRAPASRPYPSLESILTQKARSRRTNLRGVELRFYDPRGIVAGYALDPRYKNSSCKDLFQYLLRSDRFGPSCGETSNALKSVLFDGNTTSRSGEEALYSALRNSPDTFMRVQIGCHSFVIEKRNDTCRIFQSYDSWYSMADSMPDDDALPTDQFITMIRSVIQKDQRPTARAERAEQTLFHGEVDATRNAKQGQRYQIVTEVPQRRTASSDVSTKMDALLNRHDGLWTAFENEDATVEQFCRTFWPELFAA